MPLAYILPKPAERDVQAATEQSSNSPSFLVRKLSAFARFNDTEIETLESLSRCSRVHGCEQILIHEGSCVDSIYLVVTGLACKYKMLATGRRQILGYLLPGDLCDFHLRFENRFDYGVVSVGKSLVAEIPINKMMRLIELHPNIGRAMSAAAVADAVILREWLLNVGQRDALQRLSHFFCEMADRLKSVGGTNDDGSFELPVNQVTLADTLGLTTVHVNRTLKRLRNEGLIELSHRRLAILDPDRLARIGGFDGAYLSPRVGRD